MKVYLSIDDIGLEKKPQDKYEIVGTRKRTANGWQEIEVDQAADLIGNRGHAAIPGHMVGGTKAVNCKAMQIFMLDFDEGISFKVIKGRCDDMRLPIAFAYHTFSSSEQKEKFRIAFVHETLIEDPYIIGLAISMLVRIFPECDSNCSNPDRMFFGGKELIWFDGDAHFALVQLILPFYSALDENKNFNRNINSFAKKFRIVQYNKRLAIGDSSFFKDFQEYDGNKDSLIIHKIGQSDFPSFCVIEGKVLHQSIRCRIERKNLEIRKEMGCRLLDDFISGIEVEHDPRFVILTNLMQINGGTKYFFEILEKFYETDSVEKWKNDVYHMKGYKPQRCSGQFCPYHESCENAGTIVATLARDRKVYRKDVKYHSLEKAVECMENNLYSAYRAGGTGLHLIKAQTGIGKTAAYIRLIKNNPDGKFIVAVPTTDLKGEIYGRFIEAGVPDRDIFVTRHIGRNRLIPEEVQEAVSAAYNRGEYDRPKEIVKDYYEEVKDDKDKRAVAEECRLWLEGIQALKEERIVITTHAYFVNMPATVLKDYTVIVDEDILQLYLLKQMAAVSIDSLQIMERSGPYSYAAVAEEMIRAEEGKYYAMQGRTSGIPLSAEELEQMGCADGSNINDIIHAGSYVKMKGRDDEEAVVMYFCPRRLPGAKYIVLSATLNEQIYRRYFAGDMPVYSYPEIKAGYRGKLVQYTYFSLGRSDLKKRRQVFSYGKRAAGDDKVEIITFKEAAGWEEMRGNNRSRIHFGNSTGRNTLEGKNLVVIGTPYSIPEAYKLAACYLGADVDKKVDKDPKIRRVEYNGSNFLITTYDDPLLKEIQLYAIESEMEQCIGRTRLLRRDCSVYVFSCFPCEQSEIHIRNYLQGYGEGEQEDNNENQ